MVNSLLDCARNIRDDLSRPRVLMVWGGLLLGIYLLGWWQGDFHRVALAVVVTLFLTAPRARGLMVSLALAALLWIYTARWTPPAELQGFRAEVKTEVNNVEKALKNAVR